MANVNIKFNGKEFLLSCEDGQEEHLEDLATNLNTKFNNLKTSLGNIGENKLLLITSIKVMDEYFETKKKIDLQKIEIQKIKEKFKELKTLVYNYKDDKEIEINNLINNQSNLKKEIDSQRENYENLLDKTASEIENFINKNDMSSKAQQIFKVSKKIIRKNILKKRKNNFKKANINYSLLKKIFKIHKINKNKIIGGYYPINFEIDCLQILKNLSKEGYKISLPVTKENKTMNFFEWSFNEILLLSSLGIPQPNKLKKVIPDVLLVPLVAFDRFNNRLGYGGGFYDRYLNDNKTILSIGFAFSCQKVNRLEINPFDKKLDVILTEKNTKI